MDREGEGLGGIVSGFAAGAAWLALGSIFVLASPTCVTAGSTTVLEGSGAVGGSPTTEDFTTACDVAGTNLGGIVLTILLGAVVLTGLVLQVFLLRRGLARSAAGRTTGV